MSIIKLTQDLENFKWTAYDTVGDNNSPITREHEQVQFNTPQSFYDGHSKVVTGQKEFERPNKQALADMESEFGPFATQPPDERGPYGIADYMDGRQRGRGFTAPGQAPLGFIVDMESLTGEVTSQLYVDGRISLTPLSHVVAGVNSALDYGVVPSKMIMLGPAAEGAWGVKTLPMSTYSSRILSREELEDYTNAPVGGRGVSYYGRLESLYNKGSMFQKEDGTYSTPTGEDLTVPGSSTEFQNFMEFGGRGFQRTFNIPASYPNNTSVFSIDSQFGWSHQNKFLEISGHPWAVLPTEWMSTHTTVTDVPWTQAEIDAGWLISDEEGDTRENSMKSTYRDIQQIIHPIQPIYLNSEPSSLANSSLAIQFGNSYETTEGLWPYKVLDYKGTHPLIKKQIGQRYKISTGFDIDELFDKPSFSWMSLQLKRAQDDTNRINLWLETPEGLLWQENQHMLQELNPREETRDWSKSNLIISIPPFIHATRHFGGETYIQKADFGAIFHGDPPLRTSFGGMLGKWWSGTEVGKVAKEIGDLMGAADTAIGGALAGLDSLFGGIDFNEKGGRLQFLTDKMIRLTKDDGGFGGAITNMRSAYTPYGRPPKVPTQVVFSQKGAYGRGDASENTVLNKPGDVEDTVLQRYKTLAYGDLPGLKANRGKFDVYEGSLLSPSEILGENIEIPLKAGTKSVKQGTPEHYLVGTLDGKRIKGNEIVKGIGDQGKQYDPANDPRVVDTKEKGSGLGLIKKVDGKYRNELTDKINMTPYGWRNDTIEDNNTKDFVKFKFRDITNNKYIVFRAILSGISDSITPEWGDMRYIGRPEKVYVYQGADRAVSFTFDVYPKTKQELPVLWEKLNYLVGLCYPSYFDNRMVAPFIELTIGDMFNRTPGFLSSLTLDVDDNSTWEIDEGLQFPKHITCNCSFTYVGKYIHHQKGKHYEIGWLPDGSTAAPEGTSDLGFDNWPKRQQSTWDMSKKEGIFAEIQPEKTMKEST